MAQTPISLKIHIVKSNNIKTMQVCVCCVCVCVRAVSVCVCVCVLCLCLCVCVLCLCVCVFCVCCASNAVLQQYRNEAVCVCPLLFLPVWFSSVSSQSTLIKYYVSSEWSDTKKSVLDFKISRFGERFQDFPEDFKISLEISTPCEKQCSMSLR